MLIRGEDGEARGDHSKDYLFEDNYRDSKELLFDEDI